MFKGAIKSKNIVSKGAIYDIIWMKQGGWTMERKALESMVEWKDNSRRKPLIVWGARQVGKTYLIKDIFAEKQRI